METFKQKLLLELEEQIWRKRVNLEFDKTKVPEITKLAGNKVTDIDQLKAELEKIGPKDTTKATRTIRKKLEKDLAQAYEFIANCDDTISQINEAIKKEEEKIKHLKQRVEFITTFEYKEYATD
jgi:septal ring factor EnvC (AmiA/AmiB activator)